jgi:FAD:protein FMN transferase
MADFDVTEMRTSKRHRAKFGVLRLVAALWREATCRRGADSRRGHTPPIGQVLAPESGDKSPHSKDNSPHSKIAALLRAAICSGTILACASGLLAGCHRAERSDANPPNEAVPSAVTGRAMGTTYCVKFTRLPAGVTQQQVARAIDETLLQIESRVSSWRSDSDVCRFNAYHGDDWFSVSPETVLLADAALRMSELTAGAFDPTVEPLVRLWGFGPARHADHLPPPDDAIAQARAKVDWHNLDVRLDPPALRKRRADLSVDLTAHTCGYAIDQIAARLDSLGISGYLIELSGALRAKGQSPRGRPWHTGIQQPGARTGELACAIELAGQSVSTSGDYRNFHEIAGRRYPHIIDARTGWPVAHALASVSVVCDTAMEADLLDTALMALGPDAGYDLATKRDLAALLIVRGQHGLTEKMTPRFAKLIVSGAPVSGRGN